MRGELKRMGLSIDWARRALRPAILLTTNINKKLFLDFLKAGLVYRKEAWANWDPVDNTVLAKRTSHRRQRLALRRFG
jgi:leucyl-tRNA synthetase